MGAGTGIGVGINIGTGTGTFTTVHTMHGFDLSVRPESFFGQTLMADRTYEDAETQAVMELVRPDDFCIDAGCHAGYFACLMSHLGAQVLAIDANPAQVELALINAARFPRMSVLYGALNDSCGQAKFYLPSSYDDGWGSLAAADAGGTGTIMVPTYRLDTIIPKHTSRRVRLLKMDIEGAELPALIGLGDRLTKVDYLLIECVDIIRRVDVFNSTARRISDYMLAAGFCIKHYIKKSKRWEWTQCAYNTSESSFLFVNPAIVIGELAVGAGATV